MVFVGSEALGRQRLPMPIFIGSEIHLRGFRCFWVPLMLVVVGSERKSIGEASDASWRLPLLVLFGAEAHSGSFRCFRGLPMLVLWGGIR